MKKIFFSIVTMFVACLCLNAQTSNVTFQVDMTNVAGISPDGVHIAGSFQGWSPSTSLMEDPDGDMIYTFTASIDNNSQVEYKFVNGNAWGTDESVPEACGVPNGLGAFNRIIQLLDGEVVLDPVCFSQCGACQIFVAGPGDDCINAITAVLGTNVCDTIVYPSAVAADATAAKWFVFTPATSGNYTISSCGGGVDTRVFLFEGTCEAPVYIAENDDACEMTPDNPDLFASRLIRPLVAGVPYFIIWDDRWQADGFEFTISEGGEIYSLTVSVDMTNTEVNPDGMIVGNSLGNPGVLVNVPGTNVYEYTFEYLEPGTIVGYIFSNSIDFSEYELNVPDDCGQFIQNLGANARFIIMGSSDSIQPTVCYNECGPCQNIVYASVHFVVDMEAHIQGGGTISANGMHVTGSFQNEAGFAADWVPSDILMTQITGTNKYEATVVLPAGEYEYKFVNGSEFGPGLDEIVTGDCIAPGGFGNRLLNVTTDADFESCFSYCVSCQQVLSTFDAGFDSAFTVSPNPNNGTATLSVNLDAATNLQIRLVNTLGQTVQNQQLNDVHQRSIAIDMANLPTGVYNLVLTDGIHVATKRVVVQK